jgi:hypothetical protein
MAELSGRVDTLENQISFITQDLLSKIDMSSASTQHIQWNQQLDTIDNTVTNLKQQVAVLQSLYTNLYKTVRDNYASFTGHTGQTGIHS